MSNPKVECQVHGIENFGIILKNTEDKPVRVTIESRSEIVLKPGEKKEISWSMVRAKADWEKI